MLCFCVVFYVLLPSLDVDRLSFLELRNEDWKGKLSGFHNVRSHKPTTKPNIHNLTPQFFENCSEFKWRVLQTLSLSPLVPTRGWSCSKRWMCLSLYSLPSTSSPSICDEISLNCCFSLSIAPLKSSISRLTFTKVARTQHVICNVLSRYQKLMRLTISMFSLISSGVIDKMAAISTRSFVSSSSPYSS